MQPQKNYFKRILVVRTDRIGDVLLSTPVFEALRDNYPDSYIAVMVTPLTKEIVEGNPYINEVIIYDKKGKDKGLLKLWRFILSLKRKKFDLGIVLHTKKRTNLITYLADIPRRIGYKDRKLGFLLTDKIEDARSLGLKHEVDYCLDILRKLGLGVKRNQLYMPIRKESLERAESLLKDNGISKNDKIAAIHPGASCVSKRWMKDRFVELADNLTRRYDFKVIVVGGRGDIKIADDIKKNAKVRLVSFAGQTSLQELAAVLKRSTIFISNDSGPVHIASSVGTPVISIFGRNQAGLGPVRWGPLGKYDKYLHRQTSCSVCLAHNCKVGFVCLKAITVEDVLKAVDDILKTCYHT